jgi:hypothetical protein
VKQKSSGVRTWGFLRSTYCKVKIVGLAPLFLHASFLLGVEKVKEVKRRDTRLRRKIEEVEKLPDDKRKQIVQYLDTFLDREKLLQEKQKKEKV